MINDKLIIAAAGSGKTTLLVDEALSQKSGRVLITTYTQANESEIKYKLTKKNKCIPENITVQTWFSFLLKHGVRPFQGVLYEKKVKGLILINGSSGLKGYKQPCEECQQKNQFDIKCMKCVGPIYFGEKNIEKYYFSGNQKIYSDKLSKFVFRCDEKSNGAVISRISRIYSHIYIDEVQDLAGYDLDLVKRLLNCGTKILLVGDPRQGTYSTNSAAKNKKFKRGKVVNYFFQDKSIEIDTDEISLQKNFRCNKYICDFSNKLFTNFKATTSGNKEITGHDGVFFVRQNDVNFYLNKYQPVQLRDSKRKKVDTNYKVMNFGDSKGQTFDRVLIYPTGPFLKWIKNNAVNVHEISRSKIYVAITRAKYSVAIVVNDEKISAEGISMYKIE